MMKWLEKKRGTVCVTGSEFNISFYDDEAASCYLVFIDDTGTNYGTCTVNSPMSDAMIRKKVLRRHSSLVGNRCRVAPGKLPTVRSEMGHRRDTPCHTKIKTVFFD